MQERRRLPDGFLLMLLSHHFVVAFLVLTTFVVEPAVYNFMQTQKERQPCKIKASAINKKSARRGSNPQSISKGNAENTGNADKYCGCGNIRNTLCAIKIYYLHAFYNTMQHECTMKCNMTGYVAMLCSSINFTKSF